MSVCYLPPPTPPYQGGENLKLPPYQGGGENSLNGYFRQQPVLCLSIPLLDKEGLGAVDTASERFN